jgi:RNA-directed DNA polymerase
VIAPDAQGIEIGGQLGGANSKHSVRARHTWCVSRMIFVGSFQFRGDAQNFQRQLRERFAQFNLELAEEKTRLLLFGRFAAVERRKRGQKPETFEFLGFKHVCGEDRAGRFALIRIPCTKSCRKFLARAREWLLGHRHWKRRANNSSTSR